MTARKRKTIEPGPSPGLPCSVQSLPIDAVHRGRERIIPVDRAKGNIFAPLTKTKANSCLVISRPFLPRKAADKDEFDYYFVDNKTVDRISISWAVKNYSHTFIEKSIYECDVSFFESLETICVPCDDLTYSNEGNAVNSRSTFLVSSDTHVDFMTQIASHFEEVQYIIPKLTCKDDRAAEALEKRNLKYIELDYQAVECKELEDFSPGFIFCGADWTSEFFAMARIAEKLSIPIASLQEGPQDWNMRVRQSIDGENVLRILNHYRNADIFFSQGAVTLNYIRPKYFAITGNPKIDKITEEPFPAQPMILINCNFTYISTKPSYENNRDMWLRDVVGACEELKLDYFISQHPRDDGKLEYPNVIDSSAAVISEQLSQASMVISRFSSIPYEALAHGREAIYYNPHREPMLSYTGDLYGAVKLASDKAGLKEILARHKKRMEFDKEKTAAYLSRHCGPMDGQAINRIIDLFKTLPNYSFDHDRLMEAAKTHASLLNKAVEFPGKKLNIAVFVRNSATEYSGGRYCSLMLAEALSYAGHKVFYVTENLPVFYPDFTSIPTHQDIEVCLTSTFADNLPAFPIDVVILVPGLDRFREYYLNAIAFARGNKAHLVLFNFESPNWFNELSPVQRDENLWENWQLAGKYSSAILSFTKVGSKYAEKYYREIPQSSLFDFVHPAINTFTADKVLSKEIEKEKRIIFFARFSLSAHKGSFNIPDIMCEALRGYTFVIIVGSGTIPGDINKEIRDKAKRLGIQIEYKFKLSDYEKFTEIGKACLLLFPSFFEGYGYPPIEALYFNTPCIAFELPVLRETCRDNLIFVTRGDWSAFKEKIKEVLTYDKQVQTGKEIRPVARFEAYAEKLDTLVTTLAEKSLPKELLEFKFKRILKTGKLFKIVNGKRKIDYRAVINGGSRFFAKRLPNPIYKTLRACYRMCRIVKQRVFALYKGGKNDRS